jgi:hypothetical protein
VERGRTILEPAPVWASFPITIRINLAGSEINEMQDTIRPAHNIPKLEVVVVDASFMKRNDDGF